MELANDIEFSSLCQTVQCHQFCRHSGDGQRYLNGNLITRGAQVDAFERAIADYCGAKYAVAFNSGSTALFAACHVVDLTPNDRILTTPNTFVASVTASMHKKATPIFVDIDRETGNIDLDQLELNLQTPQHTRGRTLILPVHFAGIPVDMQRIDRMIRSPDTLVIEDAAHALGSSYPDGQKVGCCAWSNMTIFSFIPQKRSQRAKEAWLQPMIPTFIYD